MRFILSLLLLITSFSFSEANPITPKEALEQLKDGNKRFVENKSMHPNRSEEHRLSLTSVQMPFAAILSCSDSRVAPEIIFDQGIGDLFVLRNAGNVIGGITQDSFDFAALNLHVPLIVVLGHENCGAVKAVLEGDKKGIYWIAKEMKPALKKVSRKAPNALKSAVIANVYWSVNKLRKNRFLFPLFMDGKLDVVGAYYHFQTGEVEFLP